MSFILNTYVKDIDTNETIAGAAVLITDKNGQAVPVNGVPVVGRTTDADGHFILPIANDNAYITVKSLGYQTISHPADDYRNDVIYLKQAAVQGKEIVISAPRKKKGNNPPPKKAPPKKSPNKRPRPEPVKTPWALIAAIGAGVILTGVTILYLVKSKSKK